MVLRRPAIRNNHRQHVKRLLQLIGKGLQQPLTLFSISGRDGRFQPFRRVVQLHCADVSGNPLYGMGYTFSRLMIIVAQRMFDLSSAICLIVNKAL